MARPDPALERFVRAEWTAVVSAVARETRDRGLAEDAVQEAIARHLASPPSTPVANLAAWITVVARNIARDRRRALASESRAYQRWLGEQTRELLRDDPSVALDLRAALALLPERQREICVRRFLAGHPIDRIARELGVTSGTVKTQLHRARRRLGVALAA